MEVSGETEIQAVVNQLVVAWNSGDRLKVADMFTADADYITADGEWVHGRHEIAQLFGDQHSDVKVSMDGFPSVRGTADLASAVCRSSINDSTTTLNMMTTLIFVRRGDRWLIDRLQNTAEKLEE